MRRDPFKKIWETGGAILSGMDGMLHGVDCDSEPRNAQSSDAVPQMTIREFMTPQPVSCRLETPLYQTLELLISEDLSALPVVDESGVVVGLLNERHLLKALGDLDAASTEAIMDAEPVTVGVDEPIVEVVDQLMAINVRQVLVLENSKLVGVVTRADLMPAILRVLRKRTLRAHRVSLVSH
jgi:CBS-domain-containing membrane protein